LRGLGYDGGKTITDDYVREVRPYFLDQRTYQRTDRPGELLQFDLWQPRREIPVGYRLPCIRTLRRSCRATSRALPLSQVQANVAEVTRRMPAPDDEQAPGGARSEAAPLPHP
jgi:hypothetical protein